MPQRLLLSLLLLLIAASLGAQQRKIQHKPYIDERRWHYGFHIGLHDQSLHLRPNGFIVPDGSAQWMSENDRQNFGFSAGILGEWRLHRNFALRLTPGLHFGSKHITFRNQADGRETTQDMKSAYIAVPLELKIAAPRFNNFRPYVVTGLTGMYDLTASKGTLVRTRPFQTYAQIGLGCDFYMPFFKLIPELKFCFGLADVLQRHRPDLTDPSQLVYTRSIDRATPGMVILNLYFE
ncbi:PorT family protein [Alloprevotella sp. OH1205_COT-284]|uniref:type IX secretion/gliding motility protein PorT/SprT n=1 Tax=Alloprevotella sp. OH1205_COT-284 TaxID=2491043 RepID=UPI000F5D942D|nr:porin family protein [Alloprevotella sp. OH1205_COT-284]RRD79781.1 PorT family protein [Alloprevotella sp. OH1205_COT-284]